jgi:Na+/glutamate symporter
MQSIALNILQRGILQRVAVIAVYFSCFLAGGFFIDWLEKRRFATAVTEARQQGITNSEDFGRLKPLIAGMDETAAFALIVVILICTLASWFLMRWVANLNWAWPVTLLKVVEFRYAMDKLGIKVSNKQISAVRDYKLPVFIALKPLFPGEHETVRAKLYPFAHDSSFSR